MEHDTERSPVVLLMVDVIHPFDFDEGERLARHAGRIVEPVRGLRERARRAGAAIVYVNDNFGRWRSSFEETVERSERGPGAELVRALHPTDEDYFVLKPHRSGFYATPLELLLRSMEAERLVLCGLTTDMCILATANDARMRGLEVCIAADGTAALDDERHQHALDLMASSFDATVANATDIDLDPRGDDHD